MQKKKCLSAMINLPMKFVLYRNVVHSEKCYVKFIIQIKVNSYIIFVQSDKGKKVCKICAIIILVLF